MGAVLMPLQRVSRSHHLPDAEGIQLKKILSMKKVNTHYLLVVVIGGRGAALTNPMNICKLDVSR